MKLYFGIFLLVPSLLVSLTQLGAAEGEKVGGQADDIDREISQLEEKRASELLTCLQLLAQKKDYARAAGAAARILITPPRKPEDVARLKALVEDVALNLLRAGKAPQEAAELCLNAAQILGEDAVLFYILALAYGELGEESKQKELQEKARAVRKENQPYWFEVGSFFARRKELRLALEGFERAASIAADKPTHFSADSQAAMASIYCRLGDYEEALRRCKNLQEIARKIVVSRASMGALVAMVYAEKGREEEIEENYEAAIEDYRKSAEFSPQPGGAYNSVGELYLKMKSYDEAQKWFSRALDSGAIPMAYAGLGDVQKELGKTDGAEKEYAKCEKALSEEVERDPSVASNYNNLAWFYATHGRELDKGIALAKKALELSPDSPEYLDTLAELHHRKGDREAAVREINRAIALDPPHIKYYRKQLEKFQKGGEEGERESQQ